MLKYPCLILDHDDTVVQSEATINYPCFCEILKEYRPGQTISLHEYTKGCFHPGFSDMCRQRYAFTEQELWSEYQYWKEYARTHIPVPYPGIDRIIRRQKEAGGTLIVISNSSAETITRDYTAHFGLQPDVIYSCDLPEHQCKPNPYPLTHIMQTYGYSPAQMLVVDDLKPAWQMCQGAGVPIAFAGWSKQDIPEIVTEMTALCNFSFSSTEELEKFLFD